jgi:acetyltransferase-like isoleucine patch superfamily enzyme
MIFHDLIETILCGVEGGIGRYLRYQYYRRRLGSCGHHVAIDAGVRFENPRSIFIGEHVWIDRNVIIIGGTKAIHGPNVRAIRSTHSKPVKGGEVHIGAYSHIGIDAVIQGLGGVVIEDYCTTSAGCKIYSYSNDVSRCRTGTMRDASYVVHPVLIGRNVWLGINTIVLGHEIGADSFVRPNTLVTENIPANCIYGNDGSTNRARFEEA